jgi:hypothetical protein
MQLLTVQINFHRFDTRNKLVMYVYYKTCKVSVSQVELKRSKARQDKSLFRAEMLQLYVYLLITN